MLGFQHEFTSKRYNFLFFLENFHIYDCTKTLDLFK
jgi:hypothetical protein